MLNQKLQLKLSQKLSPQQIQLMKLIQLTTAELEQKIKNEIEENPAIELGSESVENDSNEFESNNEEGDVNVDPLGSDGADDPKDTNRNEILELWEANKDDQAFRDEFVALGNEIPEEEVTEADLEAARLVEEAAAAAEAEAEAQRQEEIDNLMPNLEEAGYDLNSAMEDIT